VCVTTLICLATLAPPVVRAQTTNAAPIVAVFDIKDQGVGLGPDVIVRLSDYLAMRLAGTGRFLVVPRDDIKARLSQQQTTSYKECYDQACQVELGRELAAQKSLSSTVAKLGSKCVVSAMLYDLKKAVAEQSGTAKGGCTEDGIVDSMEAMVDVLAAAKAAGNTPGIVPVLLPPVEEVRKIEATKEERLATADARARDSTLYNEDRATGKGVSDRKYLPGESDGRGGKPIALGRSRTATRLILSGSIILSVSWLSGAIVSTAWPNGHPSKYEVPMTWVPVVGPIIAAGFCAAPGFGSTSYKCSEAGFALYLVDAALQTAGLTLLAVGLAHPELGRGNAGRNDQNDRPLVWIQPTFAAPGALVGMRW